MSLERTTGTMGLISPDNFDMERTGWVEAMGNDYILAHNPCFKYPDTRNPFKLEQVLTVFCEEGCMDVTINFKHYHLVKNDMVIILAGHIIMEESRSPDFSGTYILMSGKFLDGMNIGDSYSYYQSVERSPLFSLAENMSDAIRRYIEMARSIIGMSSFHPNAEEGALLVNRAFFVLLGWFLHKDAVQETLLLTHENEIMSGFISLVQKNYSSHRDVEFYADKMNMTPKYMSTVIKRISGKTAIQWIEEYVVLDAKAQLSSSVKPVQKIAYDLNFPNQSFFGLYFKRIAGMAPSQYRKAIRQQVKNIK